MNGMLSTKPEAQAKEGRGEDEKVEGGRGGIENTEREKERERETGTERSSGLRWMANKTAAERQDNFSHFSGGGRRGRETEKEREREREREGGRVREERRGGP